MTNTKHTPELLEELVGPMKHEQGPIMTLYEAEKERRRLDGYKRRQPRRATIRHGCGHRTAVSAWDWAGRPIGGATNLCPNCKIKEAR